MTVHAAKRFRWALTETAKFGGADPKVAKKVIIDKRMDQSAIPFVGDIQARPAALKKNWKRGGLEQLNKME